MNMKLQQGVGVIGFGFVMSWILYPFVESKRVPQLFGMAAGCLLIDAAIWLLWRDEETVIRSFMAQALIGLGVAANRVRLTATTPCAF